MHVNARTYGNQRSPPFGSSLWWTAMLLTTMDSEYWPRTPEGRLIWLALSVYAFAVFG